MLLVLLPVLGVHFLLSEYSFLTVSVSWDSDCLQWNPRCSDWPKIPFQETPEHSQWLSLMLKSLSLKKPLYSWDATILPGWRLTCTGMSSPHSRGCSGSLGIILETPWFAAWAALRLSLSSRTLRSTWREPLCTWAIRLCTSVLWVHSVWGCRGSWT